MRIDWLNIGVTNEAFTLPRCCRTGRWGVAPVPPVNRAMLELRPDLVVAFPGGTGTAHMVSLAKKFGIEVVEVPA